MAGAGVEPDPKAHPAHGQRPLGRGEVPVAGHLVGGVEPGADHQVGPVGQPDQDASDLARIVLTVRIQLDGAVVAGIDRMAESRAQCGADPQVNRHGRDRNPHPADFADGAVDRSVIDHQQVQVGETAPNRLEALQQRRDRRLLVVGGHDHEDAWARRRTALINQAGLHRSRLPPVLPQSRPHPVLRPRSTPPAQPGWSCRRLNRLTVPHRRLRG